MYASAMPNKFYVHTKQRWEAGMGREVETHLQTASIDENVLNFLILLIEADMELQNSTIGEKEN